MPRKPTEPETLNMLEDEDEFVRACYYGDYGTGKTIALAHAANLCEDGERVVFIAAEAGLKKRPLTQLGVDLSRIEVWPGKGADIDFDLIESKIEKIRSELFDDPDVIRAVLWDSATETQKMFLRPIRERAYDKAISKNKDREPYDIWQDDYGTSTEQLRELLRPLTKLPCHLAIAALERRDQDDDGTVVYGPGVTPAFQTDLGGFCDIVLHVFTKPHPDDPDDLVYCADTRRAGKYKAKDRFNVLPRTMVYPTMDRVVAYVTGELLPEDDHIQLELSEKFKKAGRNTDTEDTDTDDGDVDDDE